MEKDKKIRPPFPPEEKEVPVLDVPIEDWYDPTGGMWTQEIKPPDPRRRNEPLPRVGYWSNHWVNTDILDAREEERTGYEGGDEGTDLE